VIIPGCIRQRAVPADETGLPAGLHPVVRRVLLARGVIDAASLQLDLSRMLPPAQLSGIDQATHR
jgi:single-stranded-DNA-specific exonuclease